MPRARGPDDDNVWLSADRHVGVSHRRSAIIDLSLGGHQSMTPKEAAA
jgi:asparagine synthetase B (glutamine-hydrolysing)